MPAFADALATIGSMFADIVPIVVFLFGFQALVIRRPLPHAGAIVAGLGLTVLGLGLFLVGLEQALFPLGRLMARQLTAPEFLGVDLSIAAPAWSDYLWVYVFAATMGFATALAEPALLAVSMKANDVSGGAISIRGLRVAVAIGVATGVSLGCFRIVTGLPLHWFFVGGYLAVVVQTIRAPRLIVPLAYDSGAITTSTVTVPLIAALGLGLAEAVPGRSPLLDGFGLVAFANLFAIISVLTYAQLTLAVDRYRERRTRMMRAEKSDSEEEN